MSTIVHDDRITSAQFNSSGSVILTTSADGTAKVSDADTGEVLSTIVHDDTITSMELNSDWSRLITTSADGNARIWDVVNEKEMTVLEGINLDVFTVTFSADGNWIIIGSRELPARFRGIAESTDTLLEKAQQCLIHLWHKDECRELFGEASC